jgi:hypothetical protein
MADSTHGFPEGDKEPSSKTEKNPTPLEKALRSGEKREGTAKVSTDAPDETVPRCQWTLVVTVVAKDLNWTGPVTVTIAGAGERFTPDEQPTQMVEGATAKVVFQGTGDQALTVTASAKNWRLVEAKPVTLQNGTEKTVELEIEPLVRIEIRHHDGMMAAKKHLLLPNTRRFKAVLIPDIEGGEYTWEKLEGKNYSHAGSGENVEVTGAETETGDAEITVSWKRGGLSATSPAHRAAARSGIPG